MLHKVYMTTFETLRTCAFWARRGWGGGGCLANSRNTKLNMKTLMDSKLTVIDCYLIMDQYSLTWDWGWLKRNIQICLNSLERAYRNIGIKKDLGEKVALVSFLWKGIWVNIGLIGVAFINQIQLYETFWWN